MQNIIGIAYAISRSAGELCKKTVTACAHSLGREIKIITHEQPAHLYKEASNKEVHDLLCGSLNYLITNGANVGIISANSVHRVFKSVESEIHADHPEFKLLSIIDETVKFALNNNFKKLAIFGSDSTIRSGLYSIPLNTNGIDIVELNPDQQSFMNKLIKTGVSEDTDEPTREELAKIAQTLASEGGAEAIVLACAELPVIFNSKNLGVTALDTNAILAQAALQAVWRGKLSLSNE